MKQAHPLTTNLMAAPPTLGCLTAPSLAFSQDHHRDIQVLLLQGEVPGFLWVPLLCRAFAMPSLLADWGQQLTKASGTLCSLLEPDTQIPAMEGQAQLILEIENESRAHISPQTMMFKRLSCSFWYPHATFPVSLEQQSGAGLGVLSC